MELDFNIYKEELLKRKEELERIIKNLKREFSGLDSCDIKEDIDYATCSANSESNYIVLKQQEQELLEVNEALKKIDIGKYGICEMCDEPINPERLKIKPFARYCIDCREIIEKEDRGS
jgi:DnaK suppressor protein